MPLIEVVLIPGSTGANVQELHAQLTGLGAVIAPAEQSSKNYGPSTVAAVRAFRQQYGLPAGESVDKPTARLLHAASTFAGTGGRVALRAAVREAAAAADTSQPQELYWLARYATLSRHNHALPRCHILRTFTTIAAISIRWMCSMTCNIKSLRWASLRATRHRRSLASRTGGLCLFRLP